MRRAIEGYHTGDDGHWVAELSCLHGQHVRHQPPWQERPWVLSEAGRESHLGTDIDCPLCDRAELPQGLQVVRTAGPFDADSVPAALRKHHLVADRTWGRLRVLEGEVGFAMETSPPIRRTVRAGDEQPIAPGVPHALTVEGPVTLVVDFLVRPG